MNDIPTPETDDFEDGCINPAAWGDFARSLERDRDNAKDRLAALLAFVLEDFQPGMTTRGFREAVENASALLGLEIPK